MLSLLNNFSINYAYVSYKNDIYVRSLRMQYLHDFCVSRLIFTITVSFCIYFFFNISSFFFQFITLFSYFFFLFFKLFLFFFKFIISFLRYFSSLLPHAVSNWQVLANHFHHIVLRSYCLKVILSLFFLVFMFGL